MIYRNDLADGFAHHIQRWAEASGECADHVSLLVQAARLVSSANQEGHICIDIESLARFWPALGKEEVTRRLRISPLVADARNADCEPRPLVIDGEGRIYLHRYFDYERRLAVCLIRRLEPLPAVVAVQPPIAARVDWQKLASALAARRRLTIISGGPGTGKTTTVAHLLTRLLEQNPDVQIALAAPTGKAASRMLEALRHPLAWLSPELRKRLPRESYTLHRLLGVTPDAGRFRHHADNPLPFDVVVVDEASMLDLALATRLLEAVPLSARLILLGDKDQLAAVEAGAVFAELSADPSLTPACIADLAQATGIPIEAIRPPTPIQSTPLKDSVVWFRESHRFPAESGIGRLAADINAGRGEAICAWLPDADLDGSAGVTWFAEDTDTAIHKIILSGYDEYLQALRQPVINRAAVFRAFDRFRVLCAVWESGRGVWAINRIVDAFVRHAVGWGGNAELDPWYPGRPVMVHRNDYVLQVFNGEVGICLPDETGKLMVYFPGQGDSETETIFRPIAPLRLPEHDSAYASTVHKSQGSEFATVLFLLPAQQSRVLSRELIYTGVTRATEQVILVGSREVFLAAVNNPTKRHSGLVARLQAFDCKHSPSSERRGVGER